MRRDERAQSNRHRGGTGGFRNSGISAVGAMPWGSHVFAFYETLEDLLDITVAYIEAGLANNECCVWAVSPAGLYKAQLALSARIPNYADYASRGQIELVDGLRRYATVNDFGFELVKARWQQKLDETLAPVMTASGSAVASFGARTPIATVSSLARRRSIGSSAARGSSPCVPVRCATAVGQTSWTWPRPIIRPLPGATANGCSWPLTNLRGLFTSKAHQRQRSTRHEPGKLTPRERLVLDQIVMGATSKETARAIGLSPRTVEHYRASHHEETRGEEHRRPRPPDDAPIAPARAAARHSLFAVLPLQLHATVLEAVGVGGVGYQRPGIAIAMGGEPLAATPCATSQAFTASARAPDSFML